MMNEIEPFVDSCITLRDGRTLAYAEYGQPAGEPVFFFHGTPGARLLHPGAMKAGAANTRIITLDRAGYGRSDPVSRGGMLECAGELAELADALRIGHFAVAGASGGGPYAAACASKLAERVTALGLICSIAPLLSDEQAVTGEVEAHADADEETLKARTLSWPEFLTWFRETNGDAPPEPEAILTNLANALPPCDKQVLALPEIQGWFRLALPEAFRQGTVGWAWDSWTLARPWGFSVKDISVRTFLWHGLEDQSAPIKSAHFLAQTIPNCIATFYPDTGHLIPPQRWDEILSALVTAPNKVTNLSYQS